METPVLVLLLVLAAYSIVFAVLARRWPFQLLAIVLLLLLVHELLLRWLTYWFHASPFVVTGASLWKDGALLGLAAVWFGREWTERRREREPHIRTMRIAMGWALAGVVGIGLAHILVSPNRLAALFAFRDYYEPVVVLLLAATFLPARGQLQKLLVLWLGALAALALLGTWQTLFWTPADYLRWGFGEAVSDLGVPPLQLGGAQILRGPSTLSGPNELGMHLVLGMIALAQVAFSASRPLRWAIAVAGAWFAVALAVTYSRGDILAFPIGLVVIYLARHFRRGSVNLPALAVHAVMIAALALASIRSGLWGFMEETAENLPQDYHVLDSVEALQYLVDHPGGVGFGLVGPRIGKFFPSPSDVAFHIEGSIFQIAFELGVVGLTFWLIFLAVCTWFGWKAWMAISSTEMQAVAAVAIAGGIGSLVVFLFIPLMQSLTMMAWMWFFLGLTLAAVETEGYWMRLQAGAVPSDRELP